MLSSAANRKFKIFKAFLNALWNLPWTLGYTQLEMIHLVTLRYKDSSVGYSSSVLSCLIFTDHGILLHFIIEHCKTCVILILIIDPMPCVPYTHHITIVAAKILKESERQDWSD